VYDVAGNSTTRTLSALIDLHAPTAAVQDVSGTAGNAGWYTSDVTVTFRGTDPLSGFAGTPPTSTKDENVTSSGQGTGISVSSPAFTDRAGNTLAAGSVTRSYNIDMGGPQVSCDPAPTGWSATDVSVACQASDGVSGLGTPETHPST
jgi:hypothetical protein